MDEITRARAISFFVFWLGFSCAVLICNRWPKLNETSLIAASSWALHLVRLAIPAWLAKLFFPRR